MPNVKNDATEVDDDAESGTSPLASSSIDPLEALLKVHVPSEDDLTETLGVPVKAKGGSVEIPWTIGVLDQVRIEEIRDASTAWVRKPGARRERVQELDMGKFNRGLIIEATLSPDLTDPRLVAKYAPAKNTSAMLDTMLKPGTIQKLGDKVLDHSGFDDEELRAEGKG